MHLEYMYALRLPHTGLLVTPQAMATAVACAVEHLGSLSEFGALQVDFNNTLLTITHSSDLRRWEKIRCVPPQSAEILTGRKGHVTPPAPVKIV